ncbi:nucleoside triphosphatase YtkD [Aquibacillus sp. 3ASR75-11]|uniref:Nucleoside triphosphatase YtkD n=1 Tax=Terrihalobacillus insolitus TaxID=2950438 RepID=A0A9X3WPQ5_9BACI|nr:nucleoside triphosphatase YtkD [Terrihalobacillus insolitus]MDC3412412.1 nucleoside triphosphatase YtkD [Terrihalobacillus insolitus]MDC3422895.1 nucleoside triphosphatase YtkD [Terrihalobacillus insolitus]
MIRFTDYYNNEVQLSFENQPFSMEPKHVWVICQYKDQWLLTRHLDRGIEFPGGKVEEQELAEEAAVREVNEETGGIVKQITYIGQYYVTGKSSNIIKNIYFARIEKLEKHPHYFETDGPVLLDDIPKDLERDASFSFMMKDRILPESLERINQLKLL